MERQNKSSNKISRDGIRDYVNGGYCYFFDRDETEEDRKYRFTFDKIIYFVNEPILLRRFLKLYFWLWFVLTKYAK